MSDKIQEWVARHDCELADRDVVRELGLPFVLVRSSGALKMVYLNTGQIAEASDAEIILWYRCKELYLRHYGRLSHEGLNGRPTGSAPEPPSNFEG